MGIPTDTSKPGNPLVASGYVPRPIQVGVKGVSTGLALEEPAVSSGVGGVASVTLLARVSGIDVNDSHAFECGLVLEKALQLAEGSLVNPLIILRRPTNVLQVLHH